MHINASQHAVISKHPLDRERLTGLGTHPPVNVLHRHQVQGLEGVTCRRDEVKAHMDAGIVVVHQGTLDLQLLLEICLKLSIQVVNYWLVAGKKNII